MASAFLLYRNNPQLLFTSFQQKQTRYTVLLGQRVFQILNLFTVNGDGSRLHERTRFSLAARQLTFHQHINQGDPFSNSEHWGII